MSKYTVSRLRVPDLRRAQAAWAAWGKQACSAEMGTQTSRRISGRLLLISLVLALPRGGKTRRSGVEDLFNRLP